MTSTATSSAAGTTTPSIGAVVAARREAAAAARQARADAFTALVELAVELQGVTALIDSHQRLHKGIPSAETLQALHTQHLADENAKHQGAEAAMRLGLLEGPVYGHGATPAPVNVAASSLDGDIRRELRQHRHDLRIHFERFWCAWTVDAPTTADLIADVADLVRMLGTSDRSRELAAEISTTAVTLTEAATRLLDGPEKAWAGTGTPCPHCGLPSLHLIRRDDGEHVITCTKPPKAHHYAPCTCSDPLCPCKSRGVSHRHTWHDRGDRAGAPMTTWSWLQDRLGITRAVARATTPRSTSTEEPNP